MELEAQNHGGRRKRTDSLPVEGEETHHVIMRGRVFVANDTCSVAREDGTSVLCPGVLDLRTQVLEEQLRACLSQRVCIRGAADDGHRWTPRPRISRWSVVTLYAVICESWMRISQRELSGWHGESGS